MQNVSKPPHGGLGADEDYYPFGMIEPGRQYEILGDSAYRFGFNGKEHDDNIYGKDNSYDYGMRFYDPRLGRFMSVDPLSAKFPYYTPYQFAGNNPIWAIDLDGMEEFKVNPQDISKVADKTVKSISGTDSQCSKAVRNAVKELTKSDELYSKPEAKGAPAFTSAEGKVNDTQANDMGTYLVDKTQNQDWKPLDISEVQADANKGNIIVGVYNSGTKGGGGHIVLAVPDEGSPQISGGTWCGVSATKDNPIPKVMDCGNTMRESSQSANYSFSSQKQKSVKWYIYTPQIKKQDNYSNSKQQIQNASSTGGTATKIKY